jgi:arginase
MKIKTIPTLGVASSIGGPSDSCSIAPSILKSSEFSSLLDHSRLNWEPLLEVSYQNKNTINMLYKQSCVISQFTQQQLEDKKSFLLLGGDHSISIGSWAGVLNQLPENATFALIWIDAHMDAHTLETSPSGNFHGMPISVLLGEAEHDLQACFPAQDYIDGRDLYLFGIRSYEAEELVLLSKHNVNVFDMKRINKDGGTEKVLKQLIETISRCYDYFAISLDMDALSPADAPGVEMPVEEGVKAEALLSVLHKTDFGSKFVGLEISEFSPSNDIDQKTEKLIYQIINSIYK